MTQGARGARACGVGWLVASSGVGLAMAVVVGCAVAPANDCTAKATCAAGVDVTAGEASSGGEFSDPLDAGSDAAVRRPSDAGGGAVDAPTERDGDGRGAIDAANESVGEDDGGGSALVSCRTGYQCAPLVPAPWVGPMALWQTDTDTPPPACPAGYYWPVDVRQGLNAPPAVCASSCSATGQQCAGTVSIFTDSSCVTSCCSQSVSSACSVVTGCNGKQGTMQADAPTPVGGTCVPNVRPTVAPATWTTNARMCLPVELSDLTACSTGKTLCVPTPAPPFPSRPCIVQVVSDSTRIPTSCPAAYPSGPNLYYQSFADSRGCSAASCTDDGPTGGTCGGTMALSGTLASTCTVGAFTYTIGSGCSLPFVLTGPVSHVSASYTLTPGSCSVGAEGLPIGVAHPSGSTHVVCCM